MKQHKSRAQIVGTAVVGALVSTYLNAAEKTETPQQPELEPTTLLANKFEKKLDDISQSVAVLNLVELNDEGVFSLQDAIGFRVPGVMATATAGQRGQMGGLFVRGTTTGQSQIRVDGVRLSSSSLGLGGFLGSANLAGLSDVELLRGPSSAIYGGEAIGGVLALTSAKGEGAPSSKFYGEVGSFGTWLGSFATQGVVDDLAYHFNITGHTTQNDGAGRDFEQGTAALRLDYRIDDRQAIGLTYRGADDYYQTPEGGAQETRRDLHLTTLFYEAALSDIWETKLTLGLYEEALDSTYSSFDGEQVSAYWDNSLKWSDAQQTVIGVSYESNRYQSSYAPATGQRGVIGWYARHDATIESLRVNGGVRWEDHDDFGSELTWSLGGRYDLGLGVSLVANIAESFRTPTYLDLNGYPDSEWGLGAPPAVGLDPESGLGWDVGVEKLWGGGKASLTWFEIDMENEIIPGGGGFPYSNAEGKTKRNGLEGAISQNFESLNSKLWASYTYLQHSNDGNSFPQQVVSTGASCHPYDRTELGCSASWVDQARWSSHGEEINDYLLVNFFVNYQLRDHVKLHARVENLLDDEYAVFVTPASDWSAKTVYPGRGRGFFIGATIDW